MQALGNDFIIIKKVEASFLTTNNIIFLANRKLGIGADQVIFYEQTEKNKLELEIYNSDGTKAEACGNAFRCLSKYFFDNNSSLSKTSLNELTLVAANKTYIGSIENNKITINMGLFNYNSAQQIKTIDASSFTAELGLLKNYSKFVYVNVGNPHIVLLNEGNNNAAIDLNSIGPFLEKHEIFPDGINIEIITISNKNTIYMDIWERGVGKTLACGTGACAAFLAANYLNLVNNNTTIIMPGGELIIALKNNYLYMEGEANLVFTGKINII